MTSRSVSKTLFNSITGASLLLYICLGYFTVRSNFPQLITLYGLLFAGYFYISFNELDEKKIQTGIVLAIIFRLSLLFMLPNLSDDYFRFIWDGRLFVHGINPFSVLPSQIINSPQAASMGLSRHLFKSLNSPDYYSIYPPVLQFVFWISAQLFHNSLRGAVLVMRIFIIAADIGSIFIIKKLLSELKRPPQLVLLYALNPLIIMELTGNIHFEAFMIFFVLAALLLLYRNKIYLSATVFALAICSKLLPLMFLPLLLKRYGFKTSLKYYLTCAIVCAILFLPFFNFETIKHILASTDLYFQKFEFNASIFYLVRWAGFKIVGYDIIHRAGIVLSFIVAMTIIIISITQKKSFSSLFTYMLFCLTFYFACASIVHPWYISTLIAFSIFTNRKYPFIWSALIVLSYFTYRTIPYNESTWLLAIEYFILGIFILYEITNDNKVANFCKSL